MAAPIKPAGAKSDKIWRAAVMRAVHRVSEDGQTKHLDILADKLVALAASGDVAALKEVGDRLDGKPAQAVTGPNGGPLEIFDAASLAKLTDAELEQLIAIRAKLAAALGVGSGEESQET